MQWPASGSGRFTTCRYSFRLETLWISEPVWRQWKTNEFVTLVEVKHRFLGHRARCIAEVLTALGLCNWTDMFGHNQRSRYKAAKNEVMNVEQKLRAVSIFGGVLDQYSEPALRGTGGRCADPSTSLNAVEIHSILSAVYSTRWSLTSLRRPYCSSLLYDTV